MAAVNLDNVQGDLFSRGFPKIKETYYFFSIVPGKEKDFSTALAALGNSGKISSLKKVLDDWVKVDGAPKNEIVPVSNALIAFSKTGLDKIQTGLTGRGLDLDNLTTSDPAFAAGMARDGPENLNDPAPTSWDPLFNASPIHGILKVAGHCQEIVNSKLDEIKKILGYPNIIADIAAQSLPTSANSRVDGQVRPKDQGLNGREHFGFEDGVSQPLLKGINEDAAFNKDTFMPRRGRSPHCGEWTLQNVPRGWWKAAFSSFASSSKTFRGLLSSPRNSKMELAQTLITVVQSAPIVLFPDQDATSDPVASNDFKFTNNNVCPLAAHIRKTNPRDDSVFTRNARIVRNGIPYGSEFSVDESGKRGLLFACYQSSIDNGFQFIQKIWINNPEFPEAPSTAGFDPFTAQPPNDGQLHITMFDPSEKKLDTGLGHFPKLVTMKGGEYFFVPSISALTGTLGSA
ncbi:hypothetical protein EPUS_03410 [Endocarpon pusillum Z07020]|uniref:Dyp-type peroxidase n=1 Tax=Endocarpon pusillum (strain Z07020 / HMAS-L-300199) TaxID=1263415 RepID=U1HUC4_ENDPU|nr:uncharacterized protein EPUS_03410 [Endocarpon pusillum Z07020]ERF74220.1 hypothetical protein EPUS_03410 [Endocarpon pusillum Z07020]